MKEARIEVPSEIYYPNIVHFFHPDVVAFAFPIVNKDAVILHIWSEEDSEEHVSKEVRFWMDRVMEHER